MTGGADQSYGIHVAKLAGVPKSVVKRPNQKLQNQQAQNNH
jgi:DNA mismatch repair ATPase MutS